jgi:YbbR domain-containing protein
VENDLKRNIYLSLVSLFFGFFLWLYVLSSAQTKGVHVLRLNIDVPKGQAVSNKVIKEIKYKIKGPRVFIRSLINDNHNFILDMKKYWVKGKTEYSFDVRDLGVEFPFGVEVEEVEPLKFDIEFENSMIKQIPIELKTIGKIPVDHKLISAELKPKNINIAGPKSLLKNVFKIDSTPINLSTLKGNDKKIIKLIPLDDRIELSQNTFEYVYNVKPTRSNMVIRDVPIRFLSSKIVKGSNRRKVNLMVLADNEDKLKFTNEDLEVIAQIPFDAKGKIKVPLKVNLPAGMHILEIIPSEIEVELESKD